MFVHRSHERAAVEIPVLVTTVLDHLEGRIVDLSEGGAQIVGCTLAPHTRCQIEYDGAVTFGIVRWSEIDRVGIAFTESMTDGPLLAELNRVRAIQKANLESLPSVPVKPAPSASRFSFGRRIS